LIVVKGGAAVFAGRLRRVGVVGADVLREGLTQRR
jgi:hypothetical protein